MMHILSALFGCKHDDINPGCRWCSFLLRRFERDALRRFRHQMPWRHCWTFSRRPCLRCSWRTVTGRNRRDKAAHIAQLKAMRDDRTPHIIVVPRKQFRRLMEPDA